MKDFERTRTLAIAVLLSLFSTACHNSSGGGSTPPPPSSQTLNFSGTVSPGGNDFHTFNVSASGSLSVTLTSLNPSDMPVGVGIGVPEGGGCKVLSQASTITLPGSSPQLIGNSTGAGQLCIDVYDPGTLTGPVSYNLTVVAPSGTSTASVARFTIQQVSPTLPKIVPPTVPLPPLAKQPAGITITSPEPPTSYVPLMSKEGLQAAMQEYNLATQADPKALTIEDQIRPHGFATINPPSQ